MEPNEDRNRRLLRARDTMDRDFAEPLDVPVLARVALMSPAHLISQPAANMGEITHKDLGRWKCGAEADRQG